MRAKPEEIVSVLREEIQNYDTRVRRDETGTVLEVGDGIATVYGLDQAVYGELVELDTGVKGMVMNLARDSVGVVLLGIAVLNFVNLLVAKAVSRRREFAVYQSLGMTTGQLRRLMLLEGGFYALVMAAVLVPVTVAFALWVMPGVIADLSWVAVYSFTVAPLWIALPVVAALALVTPLACLHFVTKGTIQQRLGAIE